jgi:transcriptional regulator with PAS, ATPase and Fis domain
MSSSAGTGIVILARAGALREAWIQACGRSHGAALHVLPDQTGDAWINAAVSALLHLDRPGTRTLVAVVPRDCAGVASARLLLLAGAGDVVREDDPDPAGTLAAVVERLAVRTDRAHALERAGLLGRTPSMRRVRIRLAEALEDTDLPVLLLGETGTGKWLAAHALHRADAQRQAHPFHALDCGAVSEGLFGSELFGHVRGAFTGAQDNRSGAIASAGAGTLLLDEIGELPPTLQAAFLAALQDRRFRPVGSDRAEPIRCRIVAATNRDLPAMVRDKQFRPDLFFRLDGLRVTLPPLRDRRADLPDLFAAMLTRHAPAGWRTAQTDPEVLEFLGDHPLPGNVRQLETIARQAIRAAGPAARVRVSHLPLELEPFEREVLTPVPPDIREMVAQGMRLSSILAACTRNAVTAALQLSELRLGVGRRTEVIRTAASMLGVSERTLYYRLRDAGEPVQAIDPRPGVHPADR